MLKFNTKIYTCKKNQVTIAKRALERLTLDLRFG